MEKTSADVLIEKETSDQLFQLGFEIQRNKCDIIRDEMPHQLVELKKDIAEAKKLCSINTQKSLDIISPVKEYEQYQPDKYTLNEKESLEKRKKMWEDIRDNYKSGCVTISTGEYAKLLRMKQQFDTCPRCDEGMSTNGSTYCPYCKRDFMNDDY